MPLLLSDAESETSDELSAFVGKVLDGRYAVDGIIGKGGMGVVVSGRQLELDRPVAIKLLRRSLIGDARLMQRFQLEARAIAQMRSEYVVRVYDVGVAERVPFIVMERLHGRDLASELEAGPLPKEAAVEFLLQACEAIGEAHSAGIVHRDIKPSNLFLAAGIGSRRQAKVLDFGVSKWLRRPESHAELVTGERTLIGTPAYAAPEQLTNPEVVGHRADIWSLGVVLYHALSGNLPFEGDNIPRLCAEILTSEVPPLAGVPARLAEVVARCLRKDPAERYDGVAELAKALEPFAPPRALHLVESIATFRTARTSRNLVDLRAPAREASDTAPFETASEFTQDRTVQEAPAKRRRPLLGAGALFAGALALVIAGTFELQGRAPSRSRASVSIPTSSVGIGAPSVRLAAPPPAQASATTPVKDSAAIPRSERGVPTVAPRRPAPRAAPPNRRAEPVASATPERGPAPSVSARPLPNDDFSSLYRR